MTYFLPIVFLVDVLFFWSVISVVVQRRKAARHHAFQLARESLLRTAVFGTPGTPQEFCSLADSASLFGYRGVVVFFADSAQTVCSVASSTETKEFPYACWRALAAMRWSEQPVSAAMIDGPATEPLAELECWPTLTSFIPVFDDDVLISIVAVDSANVGGARDERLEQAWRADLVTAYRATVPVLHKPESSRDSASAFFEPTNEHGDDNGFVWLGQARREGHVGHGFWRTYAMSDGSLAVVLGESIRESPGDALRMLATRACCDTLVAQTQGTLAASWLLSKLNRFLWRSEPMGTNCMAAVFDARSRVVSYAIAGRVFAFCVRWRDEETTVRPLPGHGPVLGDLANATYRGSSRGLLANDTMVFLSARMVSHRLRVRSVFEQALRERLVAGPRLSTDDLRATILDVLGQGSRKEREQTLVVVQLSSEG